MVSGNLAIQVSKKLERSSQYALRYIVLEVKQRTGLLQIIRKEKEFKIDKISPKRKRTLAIDNFPFHVQYGGGK